MPNAAGKPIFEDVVGLLQSKPNPMEMGRHTEFVAACMADLASRLGNLEFESLKTAHAVAASGDRVAAIEERARVLEGDRDDFKKRIDAAEKAPAADAKKTEDLSKRVSTVEGAVGSTGFKEAKTPKPTETPKAPQHV